MEVTGDTTASNGQGRNRDRPIKRTRMSVPSRNGVDGSGVGADDVIVIDD